MTVAAAQAAPRGNPWQSETVVIREKIAEAPGVTTYCVAFADRRLGESFRFLPGQFGMLYLPGAGESPIGVSGSSAKDGTWSFTVRAAGNTTRGLAALQRGDTFGLRGPFGSCWPLDACRGRDVLIAAGGLGLPPLRPLVQEVLANRQDYGRVTLLYGARTPDALIYAREYDDWRRGGIDVSVTVDQADVNWSGHVGVVPLLLDRLPWLTEKTVLLTCGPEVMMRYVMLSALRRGLVKERCWISTERNMQCAIGLCGHCQLGPDFICKDGPVFRFDRIEPWLAVEGF
ncbi:MAG TPA: FAD/NAD(P)-binding protein [Pirellulales bacterium]|nr:FAD/NAD(P)-binding protein [Pirellulales bacterium]